MDGAVGNVRVHTAHAGDQKQKNRLLCNHIIMHIFKQPFVGDFRLATTFLFLLLRFAFIIRVFRAMRHYVTTTAAVAMYLHSRVYRACSQSG